MKDNQKTKKQLIEELNMLRQKVAALEIAGSQPVATGLRDASKAQQEDNAAKPKRKESRSFQEEKLNLVIEEAGLTSWDWDIEHDRKVFNVIWAEKLGYTLEEFNSSLQEFSLDYFQHPEDLPAAQQAMKDCLTGKTSIYRAEYRLRTKTGDWKWMLALGKIIERNAEGKPTLMAGVNLDISERKQAEEALRESEARFRRTFDQSPIGAAIVSLDYRFVRVNEALCCIMGYSEEELTSLGFADITHLDHLATDMEQVRRLEAGEIERYVTDKRYIRKDGSVVWGHLSVCIVKDTAGRSLYFLPMIEDITERKRAENALQLTQFTMDHAVDSIFWVRDDARFV